MDTDAERQGLQWQVGVWDRISELYLREVDPRFATVVENVVRRGDLKRVTGSSTLVQVRAQLPLVRQVLSVLPARSLGSTSARTCWR